MAGHITISGDELMAMEIDEVQFLISPYIPADGAITLLHGKFGTFKTPLALNLFHAIATGEELWGLETNQAGPLLFVQADAPKNVIAPRMKSLDFRGLDVDFAFVYPGFNALVNAGDTEQELRTRKGLMQDHAERGYKAVFIDALRGVHKLSDRDSETPPRVYRALASMFPGASLFIIHHDRKLSAKRQGDEGTPKDEAFSGSQAWANHATVVLRVYNTDRQNKSYIRVDHTKSQASSLQSPLMLAVEEDGARIRPRHVVTMEGVAVIIHLLKQHTPGISASALDRAIAKELGCSERTAQRRRLEYEASHEAK